jgi:hypothetical protein
MSGRQLNELNTEHIRVRQQITTIRAQLVPIMRVPAR